MLWLREHRAGIGRAIAIALAKEGAAIAVNYRSSESEAQRVVEELKPLGVKTMLAQANVGNGPETRAMVQRVISAWGRIDVMVNNAGITRDKTLRKMTDADWFEVINTNLNSVYYGVMAVMPLMIEQKYGRIINISSFVGQAGNFGQANYSASKGGIIAFTKTAAIELAKYNITVKMHWRRALPSPTCSPRFRKTSRRKSRRASPWGDSACLRKSPKPCCFSPPMQITSPVSKST